MQQFKIKDLGPKKPAEGVEIRAISGERMTMAFFRLAPGSQVPEHSHPHEQIGTVLKGSLTLFVDGGETLVEEGGAYIIPPDRPHAGKCGDVDTEIIEVFSPVREDYR